MADRGPSARRRSRAGFWIPALLCLAVVPGLQAQGPEAAGPTLESLRLADAEAGIELRATSSGTLRLVGVQVDPDGSLVLQLPRHSPGAGVEELFPAGGLVSAVRLTTERTSRGPLTRIVVSTRQAVSHSLSTEGQLLRLRLWPEGAEPRAPEAAAVGRPEAAAVLRGQIARLEAALAESERLREVLARRTESLEGENRELAQRFEVLESRRSELDSAMKSTLGQATELLRELAAEKESLGRQLAAVAGRESELQGQVEALGASLADSERARQELASRLDALVEESAELARQVDAGKAREAALETALADSRREIARLEREDSARLQAMADQLEEASAREDDLRSQLASLAAVLADVRGVDAPPPPGGEAPGTGTWTRVRTDDGYESWVRSDEPEPVAVAVAAAEGPPPAGAAPAPEAPRPAAPPAGARAEASPAETPPAPASASEAPPAEAFPAAGDDSAARLAAVVREQHALAERLARVESARRKIEAAREAEEAEVAVEGLPEGRTTGTVYLRRGPGTAHEALAVVPRGTRAQVTSRRGYWLEVRAEGRSGWVSGRYFAFEDGRGAELAAAVASAAAANAEAVDAAAGELIAEQRALVAKLEELETRCRRLESRLEGAAGREIGQGRTTVNLSLRRGPGISFPRLAVLPRGATVSVLSRGDLWHRVRAGDEVGWVFGDFLR